ncbi:MAG: GGDEF domain-containing protein [Deltaproteobacteria bacterium]|nr:GGDEF domain-containing protein [Deltaproteobacteria bacterium]MBW2415340.1 GGDEF domain-containing protein [Deltaproteobacteria bacterium]
MSHAIRQLPVVDASGALVGVVGESDILRAFARRNEQLHELATIDAITGLQTRRSITDSLQVEWERCRRHHTQLTVMMADLDHFKKINDTYGHAAGDAVLTGVSEILRGQLRATDKAGRYGGEEILVVLSQSGLQGGAIVAERWRAAAQRAAFRSGGAEVSVTVSIGVASVRTDHRAPEDLVGAADALLYRAKNAGRNRVEIGG